jgi:hypothetical protein
VTVVVVLINRSFAGSVRVPVILAPDAHFVPQVAGNAKQLAEAAEDFETRAERVT